MAKYSWYFVISDKTSYSAARLKYFHIIHQSISCIEHLFISFSSDFFIYQLDFFVFWSVWALTFSVAFDLFPEFLFFFFVFSDAVNAAAATRGVLCKKVFFRNLTTFTGKHLHQSLFFNKVAALSPATLF